MKTFDKEQIEQATNYFFQRIGKDKWKWKANSWKKIKW